MFLVWHIRAERRVGFRCYIGLICDIHDNLEKIENTRKMNFEICVATLNIYTCKIFITNIYIVEPR